MVIVMLWEWWVSDKWRSRVATPVSVDLLESNKNYNSILYTQHCIVGVNEGPGDLFAW